MVKANAGVSGHYWTRAKRVAAALAIAREDPVKSNALLAGVGEYAPHRERLSQPQIRRQRRKAWAAGDRHAFTRHLKA